MPYNRPGFAKYVKNTTGSALKHGQPFTDGTFVGVAVKQKAGHWQDGLTTQTQIAPEEAFMILTKGVVEVPTVSGLAVGDKVWIKTADMTLTETEGSNVKFGRVLEVAGERGTPAGKVRIDLDRKDSF